MGIEKKSQMEAEEAFKLDVVRVLFLRNSALCQSICKVILRSNHTACLALCNSK